MTGTATGPHLDYRVMKNGTYINPMTAFRNLSAGEPIASDQLPAFLRERDASLAELRARLADSEAVPVPSVAQSASSSSSGSPGSPASPVSSR
jgi:hypothetical protein